MAFGNDRLEGGGLVNLGDMRDFWGKRGRVAVIALYWQNNGYCTISNASRDTEEKLEEHH